MAETEKVTSEAQEKPVRRRPSNIQHMVESKDVETVQAETLAKYGFKLHTGFAADLINYTRKKHNDLPALVASRNAQTVQGKYRALYGQDITEQYAADLIAFFDKLETNDA